MAPSKSDSSSKSDARLIASLAEIRGAVLSLSDLHKAAAALSADALSSLSIKVDQVAASNPVAATETRLRAQVAELRGEIAALRTQQSEFMQEMRTAIMTLQPVDLSPAISATRGQIREQGAKLNEELEALRTLIEMAIHGQQRAQNAQIEAARKQAPATTVDTSALAAELKEHINTQIANLRGEMIQMRGHLGNLTQGQQRMQNAQAGALTRRASQRV